MGANTTQRRVLFRGLEGLSLSPSLDDGSRLDGVKLVSAGRGRVASVWLNLDGVDLFIEKTRVVDAWETDTPRAA